MGSSLISSDSLSLGLAKPARRLLAILEHVFGGVVAFGLALLLALVLAGFVMRYAFSSSILGAEDAGNWLYVAITAVGAPLALRSALAMRLDIIHVRLADRPRMVADVVAEALTLLSGLILAHGSSTAARIMGGTNAALGLPQWVPFVVFGIGGALVMLFVALDLIAKGRPEILIGAAALASVLFWCGQQGFLLSLPLAPSLAMGLIVVLGLVVAAPLPHAFFAAAYLVIPLGSALPEPALVNSALSGMMKFLLLAIPFFLLAGILLTKSGVAGRLVQFADALVGHHRGGLAQTTLLTNLLFAGASGSSIASAAFGAKMFQPELQARGYAPEKAGAIIAATSVLDNVIPPSIAFLIMATATNLSVGKLLFGGLWAGLLLAIALFVVIRLTCHDTPVSARSDGRTRVTLGLRAIPAFGLGIIVVFGIRLGFVTTTEAAAAAAFYTFLLSLFYGLKTRGLYDAFRQAGTEAAAIALLIASAAPFAFLLAVDDISGAIGAVADLLGSGPVAVLALSVAILLIAGLVLDIGAAILLFAPLLLPLATATGLDPVIFGVIIVVNLMIGGLTPPFGVLIFVVAGVTRIPTAALFRSALPHVLTLALALFAICLFALVQAGLF
ncbi:TRAP transporter large permease subunit (plasmid) [Thioclava sp. 'Guangxiensis']|uniref:TRAP transporter large permease subunit n=1 Tax=Thioclava sp. 'Guangxiensis' TaxID=3149044 RepID=UPI0032C465D1